MRQIVEERDALQHIFAKEGATGLSESLEARGGRAVAASPWAQSPDGKQLAAILRSTLGPSRNAGWFDAPEAEADEAPEEKPEMLRALATSLPDGSTLVVGNEQRGRTTACGE